MTRQQTVSQSTGAPRPARRCMVHIGLNKTGSTTIQGWLIANARALAEQGIRYDSFHEDPQVGFRHAQGFSAIGVQRTGQRISAGKVMRGLGIASPQDQADQVARFEGLAEKAIAQPGYHTYVISSEFLPAWLRKAEALEAFHNWLVQRFDEVGYIVYLRDQIDWVPSSYAQHIKTGGTVSLSEYVASRGLNNYAALCRRWTSVVGGTRLTPRLFDRTAFTGGDLIRDFSGLIGADPDILPPANIRNEAFGAYGTAIMRRVNQVTARLPDTARYTWRNKAVRFLRRGYVSTGPKITLDAAQSLDVARRNADGNETVRSRYFADRPVLFTKSHSLLSKAGAMAP